MKMTNKCATLTNNCLEMCTDVLKKNQIVWNKINHKNCVDICFQEICIRTILNDYLNLCESYKDQWLKNESDAAKLHLQGNGFLQKDNLEEALVFYSKSIFKAEPHGEGLPVAYASRSLVLCKMLKFDESLSDLNMALKTGHPDVSKLKMRKSSLLISLGKKNEAKNLLLDLLNDPSAKALHSSVQKELSKLNDYFKTKEKMNPEDLPVIKPDLPQLLGGENINFKSASAYLSLFYHEKKGRHVKATRNLEIGDVLFVEKNFAHVFFTQSNCDNCGFKVCNLIPCDMCTAVKYCSVECKEKFWRSTHLFECGYEMIFKSLGIAHLSLRIVLAASSTITELKTKLKNIGGVKQEEGKISMTTSIYTDIYNLEANIEKFSTNDLITYTLVAYLLALYMKNNTSYFPKTSNDEDLKMFTSTLLRHIAHLICNGNAICAKDSEADESRTTDLFESRVGTAIYPSISMMNHSCEPSVLTSFIGNYIVVRASKPIKAGEEVFNCYGPHARRMPREKRQAYLSSQYFFTCDCIACSPEVDIMDIFRAWKCPSCNGPCVRPRSDVSKLVEKRMCLNCEKILVPTTEQQTKSRYVESILAEGESLKEYLKAWKFAREIYYKYHTTLNDLANQISRILYEIGDLDKCIRFMKSCLICVERRYGVQSVELAREREKIAAILYQNAAAFEAEGKEKEAKRCKFEASDYLKESSKIIALLLGEEEA